MTERLINKFKSLLLANLLPINFSLPEFDNDKKKILHVIHQSVNIEIGGTELFTKWITEDLTEFVHIVLFIGQGETEIKIINDSEANQFKFKNYINKNQFKLKNKTFEKYFHNILKKISPDIVHFQNLYNYPLSLVEVAVKSKFKTILHIHDFGFFYPAFWELQLIDKNLSEEIVSLVENKYKNKKLRYKELNYFQNRLNYCLHLIEIVNKVLVPSKFVYEEIVKLGIKGDIEVLENGINVGVKPPSGRIECSHKIRIGWLGSFNNLKGARKFLELYRLDKQRNFDWIIAGKIDDSDIALKSEIRHIIDLKPANFNFIGSYNQKDLERIMNLIDIVIMPSLGVDTFSYVLSEVLGFYKLVIASDIGAIGDRLKKYKVGFVFSIDSFITETWQILNKLNNDRDFLNLEIAKIGKVKIPNRQQTNKKLEKIYRELLSVE